MSAPPPYPPRWRARLASLLSWRTISGKLIIGLIVLFGLAGAAVSVVTANTLSSSLMSSLNQQLQSATERWQNCANTGQSTGDHDMAALYPPAGDCIGQAAGTFEAVVQGGTVTSATLVSGHCELTAADIRTLRSLGTSTLSPSGQGTSAVQAGPGGQPAPAPKLPTYTRTLTSLDGTYLLTKVEIAPGEAAVTGLSIAPITAELSHVEDTEHVVFAAVLLLAVVLGAGLVQLSLRPLHRVAATATRVTELPLHAGEVMLPAGVPDSDPRTEVGRVGAAFNRMLFHVEKALSRRAASEARLRQFSADASHELRTPLSAIRGYAELALRHPGPVPEQVTHALKRVQAESTRMGVLVDDLLLLARLDAGRPLERHAVDLSRLAIETTTDAQVARGDHRWQLDLPDEPVLVSGDEHRLHQVLANLLSNAGKHTPAGSTVSVALTVGPAHSEGDAQIQEATSIQRGVLPPGPTVELDITDDGPGIPPELLPELFERFTRADTSRAREAGEAGKSTGLGLAIVDAVVSAHGGCITVTSRPGRTRFAMILPLLREPAGQPETSRR